MRNETGDQSAVHSSQSAVWLLVNLAFVPRIYLWVEVRDWIIP
ncbi:MAG: hypothetical protein OEX02_20990 [Cyclobacteriaceae bacterium]|nr:hypothetical protein [Cyclobacteriaceae bacterium]